MKIFQLAFLLLFSTCGNESYQDQTFTSYFQQNGSGWMAGDGTISIQLPDGRNLWFMGDSHVAQIQNAEGEIPCLFNTRNCILVQDSVDLSKFETLYDSTGRNSLERQFIKMEGDSTNTYWPGDAIMRRDTAVSYTHLTLPTICSV